MCNTCNGTGGINIYNGWNAEFHPCPASNCNFVPDDSDLERLKAMVGYNEMEAVTA